MALRTAPAAPPASGALSRFCGRRCFGSEMFDGGRVEGRVTHDIWIRTRSDIAPGHRLRLGSRMFNIRAVLKPDPFVNRMRLICEERDQ